MSRFGMEEGVPIEHGLVTRAIENAQKKVEGHNFDIRKHLLEYDDVLNKQREVIYDQRREVLKGEALKEQVVDMTEDLVEEIVGRYSDKEPHPSDWDLTGLRESLYHQFNLRLDFSTERGRVLIAGKSAGKWRTSGFSKPTKTRRGALASRCCGSWKKLSCCRPSTPYGKTICSIWII